MKLFRWSPACSVGNEFLDAQHQAIFAAGAAISDFLNTPDTKIAPEFEERLNELVAKLYALLRQHFQDEEALLKSVEYSAFKNHQEQHLDCDAFFQTMFNDAGSLSARAAHIQKFINGWMYQHILIEDKKYQTFLL
ncbi:MAG: hypothetical protein RIR18_820 [Pseudomonadota bacterium]|jgi:hemerythrin-like metal-binding protein